MEALCILQTLHSLPKYNDNAPVPSRLGSDFVAENEIHIDKEEDVDEQQEFSFACIGPQARLIFADEIFDKGKIRPTSATFDELLVFTTTHDNETLPLQPPLKKLFVVEKLNSSSSQSKCLLKGSCNKTSQKLTMVEVEASNKKCKKSKSTGFTMSWRFREYLKHRSKSYDMNAFVFLNSLATVQMRSSEVKEEIVDSTKGKDGKCKTTLSPHEKLYVTNRKRNKGSKRKSFLPYRKGLIEFFVNVNGFTRNVNPF